MPTYALLGATGATGSAILRCLISEPPKALTLNILVRSKAKLLSAFPRLEETSTLTVRIIEGTSTDTTALHDALEDADVVFMCVASNESTQGMSLSYDTGAAIIDSLKTPRQSGDDSYKTPIILVLRSTALNPIHAGQAPWIISFCLHYLYADLKRASSLYESAAKETPVGLLKYMFIDPPALHGAHKPERTGHELSMTKSLSTNLSYADLGAAMCEAAERRSDFSNQGVLVSATGKVKQEWGKLLVFLSLGAKNRILAMMGL